MLIEIKIKNTVFTQDFFNKKYFSNLNINLKMYQISNIEC